MNFLAEKFYYAALSSTEKSGAVQIVNGKPDFSNTTGHFVYAGCKFGFPQNRRHGLFSLL